MENKNENSVKVFKEEKPSAFEKTKSRNKTRFVTIRNYTLSKGITDIVPLFIGYEACLPSHSFGPFARNSYLIHYVLDGNGTFESKGKTYNLSKGEYFIITPNETTTYTASEKTPWKYVYVAFNGSYAVELKNLASPVGKASAYIFEEIESIVNGKGSASQDEIASLILKLFSEIFSTANPTKNVVKQIENYINTQYMSEISVEGIAEAVGLDRRYLGRIFKNEKGISIQQYIINTRLNRSVELLKQGYRVGEASLMSGYKDPFNFTKIFTKYYGMSPRAYAKQEQDKE